MVLKRVAELKADRMTASERSALMGHFSRGARLLGRDRFYRRYVTFQGIPGLFVSPPPSLEFEVASLCGPFSDTLHRSPLGVGLAGHSSAEAQLYPTVTLSESEAEHVIRCAVEEDVFAEWVPRGSQCPPRRAPTRLAWIAGTALQG